MRWLWVVYEFVRASITKYHSLGGFNNTECFLTVLEARRMKWRGQRSVAGALLSGWWCLSSVCIFMPYARDWTVALSSAHVEALNSSATVIRDGDLMDIILRLNEVTWWDW